EYDPSRQHGQVTWRVQDGLPVIEVVNNWVCRSFADSYKSLLITEQIAHVVKAVQPDVIHVHNLLNLSFGLPALARAQGVPVVATLHDYTLVCPSGGQRIHRADRHVCRTIDPGRCARCFRESPFYAQTSFGTVAAATRSSRLLNLALGIGRRLPRLAARLGRASRHARVISVSEHDI